MMPASVPSWAGDLTAPRPPAERLAPQRPRAPARAEVERRHAEAAADHDELRVEDVHERADRRRRGARRSRQDPSAGVPLVREPDELVRVRVRRRDRAARAGRPRCPSSTPRVAAARAAPWHGWPSSHDDDVPELRPSRGRAGRPVTTPPPTPVPSVSMTIVARCPRPAPARHSANAAAFASLSTPTGRPSRSAHPVAEVEVVERDVDRRQTRAPCAGRSRDGTPNPTAATSGVRQLARRTVSTSREQGLLRLDAASGARAGARPRRRGRRGRRGSSSRRGRPR